MDRSHDTASIVISSYNYARFLRACIDSALAQTYPHTEVVVVDDASTDDSPAIIREYGDRVRAVLRDRNLGGRATYDAVCAVARGDVIIILDSDDMLYPNAVERAMALFADPDVVKVHWPLKKINSIGQSLGGVVPIRPPARGNLRDEVARRGPFAFSTPPSSGNAYRRRFLQQVLPVPLDAYGDSYLSTWALVMGTIGGIDEPQGFYRLHGRNTFESIRFDEKLEHDRRHSEFCVRTLSEHFRRSGTEVDTAAWARESWYYMLLRAVDDLRRAVPEGARLILVDGDTWGVKGVVAGRPALPFLERDGMYAGNPRDSRTAIAELERMRASGAGFIVFTWQQFWWLSHYTEFTSHLRASYRCLVDNERLVVFDLHINA